MEKQSLRAVIDLGTNTFHLLIASVSAAGAIDAVYRERRFVKLAAEGIATMGAEPFARGLAALHHFREILTEYDVTNVLAFGTAALRTASNGPEFVATALRETGIAIQLIPGDEEARYITRGVLGALPPLEERILIMDIGGGSTEFIIADATEVYWRQSFPLGVSVLFNAFHDSDPISAADIARLEAFLTEQTLPLANALAEHPAHHLAGAAGTFDVLATLLKDPAAPPHPTSQRLSLTGLVDLQNQIIDATLAERLATPGIPPERADMIVMAMLLIRFVVSLAGIERITVSDWAMKEGILLLANERMRE